MDLVSGENKLGEESPFAIISIAKLDGKIKVLVVYRHVGGRLVLGCRLILVGIVLNLTRGRGSSLRIRIRRRERVWRII